MPVDQELQKSEMAKRQAAKAQKELRDQEKKDKLEATEKKAKLAKAKEERAAAAKAKAAGAKKASAGPDVPALEKEFMPLVKDGGALEAAGDLAGALALYQQAMDGFRAAGVKRPKLKEKMVRFCIVLRQSC